MGDGNGTASGGDGVCAQLLSLCSDVLFGPDVRRDQSTGCRRGVEIGEASIALSDVEWVCRRENDAVGHEFDGTDEFS